MDTTRHFYDFSVNFPNLVPFVTEFSTSLVKAHKLKIRLGFLRDCLKEQVLPKSFLPSRILKLADRPFDDFQRIYLVKHIDLTKFEVKEAFKILRSKKYSFESAVPYDWKPRLLDYCYSKLRTVCDDLKTKLNRKLSYLIQNSDWTQHANSNFVINLSDKELDSNKSSALGYGMCFATSNKDINGVDIAKAFCHLEKYGDMSNDNINICKGITYGLMCKPMTPNCPQRFVKAYHELKNDKDLHITKADKSNAIVIMNKRDYLDKIYALLDDHNTYTKLRNDPLESVNKNFNQKLKQIVGAKSPLVKQFINMSPSLPYMYGTVKTHKPNNPIRPIVSSIGSASYSLSKWLVNLLNPIVGTISQSNIKNNMDLVDKLINSNVNFDFKMVSFDVKSLFTNVPVDDLLMMLSEILDNYNLPVASPVIIELIKLCTKDCKFSFDGNFYSQQFGLPMGNVLSATLSNIYMEFFETKIMKDILPANALWFRYVDDVLCLWPTNVNLDEFLPRLNSLVPSIEFTVEIEENCTLAFLDVLIHRQDKKFKFSIYRKPTNLNAYIHYYSSHSDKVKKSVFSSMFLRALRICSPEFLDDEINNIYDISSSLKYPKIFIDKALTAARKTFYNHNDRMPFSKKNVLVLPYDERFIGLPDILKLMNVNVVFNNKSTVKNLLIKNSPDDSKGCVYRIPCNNCNKVYFGQTGKSLEQRIKQHKYSVRTGQESNAVFVHMSENNHCIDWDHAHKIVSCKDFTERNIIESCLIKYKPDYNFNISSGLYKLDNLIVERVLSSLRLMT